ncbi:MAG: DUF2341 domain-containing protein [Myxococcales bacterium]|nr:DUF2341 domain-containing protein [Myxococcales bacterium]
MRLRLAAVSACLLVGVASAPGCLVEEVDLTGLACPCGDGWACRCGVCVPEGEAGGDCPDETPWASTSHGRRRALDVAAVTEDLQDLVVQVRLTPERLDPALAGPTGEALRFFDATGRALAHEIDHWDPAGASVVWVRLPEVPKAGMRFFVYYDDSMASDVADAAATWEGYLAVWHLSPDLVDATGKGNGGTDLGTADEESPLGRARHFDQASAVDIGARPSLADVFQTGATITAVIQPNGWGGGSFGRILDKASGVAGEGGWSFQIANGGGVVESLRFERGFVDGSTSGWLGPANAVVLGSWQTVAVIYDEAGGAPLFFVDGASRGASSDGTGTGSFASDALQPLLIGNHEDIRGFDGAIDELRIAAGPRSGAFMEADHRSIRDELLSYGAEETRP